MVEVKQAVTNALVFLEDMYQGEQIDEVRLEEVELSEDGDLWHVTLSFLRGRGQSGLAKAIGSESRSREYKELTVMSRTGDVRSMKIRTLS
ncbi:MAG: hypothetical protein ABIK89_02410 [Planctomycetota bacterium]